MELLKHNIYLFVATIIVICIGLFLFFKKTGFHTKKSIILNVLIYLGIGILSYFYSSIGLLLTILLTAYHFYHHYAVTQSISLSNVKWIPSVEFENNYDESKEDESGCYVMLSFPLPVKDGNYKNYETAYVGSSTNVHKEIHKVINNKTLSRVYDDLQKGKYIYISIHPVNMSEIDQLQEKLISQYHGVPYLLSFKEVREKQKVQ
ncbi:MAG: hypothetical protein IKE51_05865 [Solobacterium sp.]|nr:hypothetical protein [Solobacterium sp.]